VIGIYERIKDALAYAGLRSIQSETNEISTLNDASTYKETQKYISHLFHLIS